MKKLILAPNKILRQKCEPVEKITPSIKKLAKGLEEFLKHEHNDKIPVGISAPQFGESVRVFAFRLNPYSEVPSTQVIINPELVYAKKARIMTEECFSLPDKEFKLRRFEIVKVRGLTLGGAVRSFRAHGVVAQAIQHELNHLDGVLIDAEDRL